MKEGLWWDKSWNPVTGCTLISPGCRNCWARRMSKRLAGRYGYPKDDPFRVTWHPERLWEPMKWKKPRRIAVSLMGDLFHSNVTDHCIGLVFWIMGNARHHTFLLLTKRPQRILNKYPIWNNVQVGVSVENQETADERIPVLLQIPAKVRFVSIEPMLGPVDVSKYLRRPERWGIDWVILGGGTGPKARPMHPDWARSVRDQCQETGVPFFFKQWGEWIPKRLYWPKTAKAIKGWGTLDIEGNWYPNTTPWNGREGEDSETREYVMYRTGAKASGRMLDGRTWEEMPE